MSQRYIGGLIYNPPGGFSGAFDTTGDYLSISDASNLASPGSGDFTAEAWINLNALPNNALGASAIYHLKNDTGTSTSVFIIEISSTGALNLSTGSALIITGTAGSIVAGTWMHIAVARQSGTLRTFINGVQSGSVSNSTTYNGSVVQLGAWRFSSADWSINGLISNFRFVKGTAVYTAAFTPPNGPLQAITNTSLLTCAYSTFRDGSTNNFTITVNGNTAVSTQNPFPLTTLPNPALGNQGNGVYSMSQYQSLLSQNLWPAVDPYWRYVTLMLHGNGTNGAQNNTFLDSSTNNFTITRNGNTTQGTFAPFGSNWSNYFDGSGDNLTVANNAALYFGTGDFTIECWIYTSATVSFQTIASVYGAPTSNNGWYFSLNSAGTGLYLSVFNGSSSVVLDAGSGLNNGAWHHVAAVRTGTTLSTYIDGARVATTTNSFNITATSDLRISGYPATSRDWNGYISNFRIIKGSGPYNASSSTLTVPASPLTAITNTSLLTCQSNRFIDNSSNNFTITRNGTPSVQRFSPFNPTAPYAAGTDGGSGYFDGTGDYLTTSTTQIIPTGSFTVECWAYVTGSGTNQKFVSQGSSGSAGRFSMGIEGGNWFTQIAGDLIQTGTPVRNQWNYIAVTYNGSTITMYVNGTSIGTVASSANAQNSALTIGQDWNTYTTTGYIADVRISNTVRTISVPTAPYTSDGNTRFLASFTNAGIIDNAEMNNLETVGNAQISTAQSKFGGASMAFDGNGDSLFMRSNPNIELKDTYTVEAWIYTNTVSGYRPIFTFEPTVASNFGTFAVVLNGSALLFEIRPTTGGSITSVSGGTISTLAWTHIAISVSSLSARLFINGIQVGSTTTVPNFSFTPIGAAVGAHANGFNSTTEVFDGYIDDLRITKGYARYTANFTPQRSQWQDQ
jgi:hypothetical protein